jgi:dihydrolipoamide dehydrogenase
MTPTDLIIIGAGPGGYRAAEYAAKQGLKVTIFEASEVGGTCLNVGCIPTKTYVHSATFDEARQRMAKVIPQLRAGVEQILSHPNITLVRARAQFADPHTVCAGSDSVTAKNILIATGSETKWLPIAGTDNPRVVDSTGLLQTDTLPKRLAIIGAGVIGMEFACAFRRFGSEVTVIEYLKECLPALDSDIAKRLRKYLEKRGISFKMKTAVQSLDDIDADCILMATGRKANTEGLNLEAAAITLTPQGTIPVDENYQLSIVNSQLNGIYAIGDVNGRQMLAHAAEMQAVRAVNHILGRQDGIRFDIMPAAIFTTPEAASVGPTEDQLKQQGVAYTCRKAFWRTNGKALAMDETEGMLKLFASTADGRILGCHAYGAHAADIVQEVSVLICRETTIEQLRDMIHIHPTLSEVLSAACSQ